jgi:hypothetical protein
MKLIPFILYGWVLVMMPITCNQVDKAFALSQSRVLDEPVVKTCVRTKRIQEPILDRDTGSGLTFEQDRARLDQFAADLKEIPNSKAFIIAYGGAVGAVGEAKSRLKCIRNYLTNHHRISSSRLVMIDGGYRAEIGVELFLVRAPDSKPQPAPTVKPSRVRIIKSKQNGCRSRV